MDSRTIASEDLLKRTIEFLKESSAYVNIFNIDYSLPSLLDGKKGYYGACLESQERALNHLPISTQDLCRWQAMIVKEQSLFGHSVAKHAIGKIRSAEVPINIKVGDYIPPDFSKVPVLIEKVVNDLNTRLQKIGNNRDEVYLASILGDIFQTFEKVHPFVEANGRVGLLIANYIVSWFGFPILVFRITEKEEFYAAHQHAKSMRVLMAKKLQEAVFDEEGKILTLSENYGLSAAYCHSGNLDGEKLLIEWHNLLHAMNQWSEELRKSTAT